MPLQGKIETEKKKGVVRGEPVVKEAARPQWRPHVPREVAVDRSPHALREGPPHAEREGCDPWKENHESGNLA